MQTKTTHGTGEDCICVFVLGGKLSTNYNLVFQTDDCNADKPKICSNRDSSDKIKVTYAQVSTECGISIEMTQIAVKTTCSSLYDHNFYHCVDDNSERDGDASQPSAKR